jgi:hypothetical protein
MSAPLTNKQQYWSMQLQDAEAFDGGIAEYARSQGVSTQTLYRWRHCLRQPDVLQTSTKRYLPRSSVQRWPLAATGHGLVTTFNFGLVIAGTPVQAVRVDEKRNAGEKRMCWDGGVKVLLVKDCPQLRFVQWLD